MSTKTLLISSVLFGLLLSVMIAGTANAYMVAYYKFEGNASDSSGNNLHGTEKGNISYVAGVSDQAIELDGKDSYMVDCGADAAFDIDHQITVAFWIKVNQFDREWQTVIAKGDDSWRISRGGATNQLHFACTGLTPSPPWVNGSINVNDGKWHHAAAVYDGARMHLYVDGIPDVSRDAHGTINTSTSPVYIGENAQKTGRYFRGLIDELTIFNHALNADGIKQLHSQGAESVSGTTDSVWSQVRTVISNIKLGDENAAAVAGEELLTNFSGDRNIAEAVFQVADAYHKLKKYTEARQLYQHVVDNWPETEHALWAQADLIKSSLALGDNTAAEAAVDTLLANFTENPLIARAVHDVAQNYRFLGKYAKANRLYQYTIDHWPTAEHALWSQADLIKSHLSHGDDPNAQAAVNRLLADFTDNPLIARAVWDTGQYYRDLKKYEMASELYQHVLDNWPDSEHALWAQADLIKSSLALGDDYTADAAVAKLLADFTDNPLITRAVWDTAQLFRSLKKYEKANSLYQHVVDNWPDSEHALWAQADLIKSYISLGDDANAESAADKLIADFNDNPLIARAAWDTANVYRDLKKYEKANELYQYSADKQPENYHALQSQLELINIGLQQKDDEATDRAIDKLLTYFATNKDIAQSAYQVAHGYINKLWSGVERGEAAQRLEYYDAKIRRLCGHILNNKPDSEQAMWAQRSIAFADIHKGDFTAAEAAIEKLLADYPDHKGLPEAFKWLGEDYHRMKQYDKARQFYQRVIDRYPGNKFAIFSHAGIAGIDIDLGDDTAALAVIDKLIADFNEHPDSPEAVFVVGEQYYYKAFENPKKCRKVKSEEPLHKAKDIWERIAAQWPESKSIGLKHAQYFTAVCYRRSGKYEKALTHYQQVVDNWPDYQYAWSAQCLVGSCYKRLRDLGKLPESVANPKIEQAYKAVLEKYPDSAAVPSASLKLGHLNLEMGRNIEAAQYFEIFLATANPNDPRIESVEARLEELKGEEQ